MGFRITSTISNFVFESWVTMSLEAVLELLPNQESWEISLKLLSALVNAASNSHRNHTTFLCKSHAILCGVICTGRGCKHPCVSVQANTMHFAHCLTSCSRSHKHTCNCYELWETHRNRCVSCTSLAWTRVQTSQVIVLLLLLYSFYANIQMQQTIC